MSSPPPPDPAAASAQAAMAAAFQKFAVEAWVLFGVAVLVTLLRTYARIKSVGTRNLQADDYLVWIGVTFYAAETVLAYSVGNLAQGFANNGMTDEQRVALSPDNPEYGLRVLGSKIQICGWASYAPLLWSLKASLLELYMRMTTGLARTYRIRIYLGYGLLLVTFVTVLLSLFLSCRPFHKNWQIYPDPGNACQPAISNQIIWTFLACNIATDLYLITIPVPMLWKSTLKPLKKVALILLFSGGFFVVACAILRVMMIVVDPENGAMAAGSWAVRETFVAVVVANLPMIFPLLKIWLASVFGSAITSLRSTNKVSKGGTPRDILTIGGGGGAGGPSGHSWRGRGPATANPITNMTFDNDSEERIMDDIKMQDLSWSESNSATTPREGGIRKHVEVSVAHEERGAHQQHDMWNDDGTRRQPNNSAFCRGA